MIADLPELKLALEAMASDPSTFHRVFIVWASKVVPTPLGFHGLHRCFPHLLISSSSMVVSKYL
jgi:hypothetical protein